MNGENATVKPNWFMSDDANQYYSRWVKTFEHEPQTLLCTWHVDRAWRDQLRRHLDGGSSA